LGLLDTMFNKESKLLEKAKKGLARVDSLDAAGKTQEAVAELDKTLAILRENMIFIGKMKRDFSVVIASLGSRLLKFDRAQMALEAARASVQLDPRNSAGMKVEGLASLKLGMKDAALSSLLNAVKISPDSEDIWASLAEVQEATTEH
jgi:predicted Zn-dependent protease